MPAMQCSAAGQFFDPVRSQCISCIDVCPPNRVPDEYCTSYCPHIPPSASEVIGSNDATSSVFSINILVATVVAIVAVLGIIIFIGIWVKRRRDQRAVSNVDPIVSIEMQPVNQPLSPCSFEEQEPERKEIRMGGYPEEDADHTATQFLPS